MQKHIFNHDGLTVSTPLTGNRLLIQHKCVCCQDVHTFYIKVNDLKRASDEAIDICLKASQSSPSLLPATLNLFDHDDRGHAD